MHPCTSSFTPHTPHKLLPTAAAALLTSGMCLLQVIISPPWLDASATLVLSDITVCHAQRMHIMHSHHETTHIIVVIAHLGWLSSKNWNRYFCPIPPPSKKNYKNQQTVKTLNCTNSKGAKNFEHDVSMPLSGMVSSWDGTRYDQPPHQIWSLYIHSLWRYERQCKM